MPAVALRREQVRPYGNNEIDEGSDSEKDNNANHRDQPDGDLRLQSDDVRLLSDGPATATHRTRYRLI